jgi:protein-L-isoaspartate(D-aspartate) O-methyltransferase
MAIMLEQLRVRRGMNVLEIGAGTGYNAALLAELAGPSGAVATIDIQADVAAEARRNLRRAGYRDVRVVRGDGARGLRSAAPFDRIIVTAGCWEIAREWLRQLKEGGVLVLPLRLNLAHVAIAFRRRGNRLVSFAAAPCGFMPMQGRTGRRMRRRIGNAHSNLFLTHDFRGARLRAGALSDLMRTPPRRVPLAGLKEITRFPASFDFWTYMALEGAPLFTLGGSLDGAPDSGIADTVHGSICLISPADAMRGEAIVYGTDDAAGLLADSLARWRARGHPAIADLRMTAEPSNGARGNEVPHSANDGGYEFVRRGMRFRAWYDA